MYTWSKSFTKNLNVKKKKKCTRYLKAFFNYTLAKIFRNLQNLNVFPCMFILYTYKCIWVCVYIV